MRALTFLGFIIVANNIACNAGLPRMKKGQIRLFPTFDYGKWPNGQTSVVYYKTEDLDAPRREAVEYAVNYMNNNISCVRWVRWNSDMVVQQKVTFLALNDTGSDGPVCGANVGFYEYWNQLIVLGNNCVKGLSTNSLRTLVLHQMMHTLGFIHEHQRPDRDCYVTIGNVLKRQPGFEKVEKEYYFDDVPYDPDSITHYFTRSGSSETVIGTSILGNRKDFGRDDGKLSTFDIGKINRLYCGEDTYCSKPENRAACQEQLNKVAGNANCDNYDFFYSGNPENPILLPTY